MDHVFLSLSGFASKEGARAFLNGVAIADCPYSGGKRACDWRIGFCAMRANRGV